MGGSKEGDEEEDRCHSPSMEGEGRVPKDEDVGSPETRSLKNGDLEITTKFKDDRASSGGKTRPLGRVFPQSGTLGGFNKDPLTAPGKAWT